MLERLNTSSSLPFTYLGRDSIGYQADRVSKAS